MALHVHRILIGIEVGVLQGIVPPLVAEHSLGDGSTCDLVEMGGSGMAEKVSMEAFINAEAVCGGSKNILQDSRRDAFFSGGEKERAFIKVKPGSIDFEEISQQFRQNDLPLPLPFLLNPCKSGPGVNMFNVKGDKSPRPQTQKTEHENHDKVSEPVGRIGLATEEFNDAVEFLYGQEMGYGFFNLRVRQTEGHIFFDMAGDGEEVKELVQAPDPGFLFVDGRRLEIGNKVGKMAICDVLYGIDLLRGSDIGGEFPEADAKRFD